MGTVPVLQVTCGQYAPETIPLIPAVGLPSHFPSLVTHTQVQGRSVLGSPFDKTIASIRDARRPLELTFYLRPAHAPGARAQ